MSENPSPKPKPGSLRDRIAAFENANKGAGPPPAPAPRPKPSTLQSWKPKVPSPPQSPESERKSSGMSASDAMESIGKGVSLKERMAALQGKGAFGGVAPPPMPQKPTEKPKWKPPPQVSPPADEAVPTAEPIDPQESVSPAADDPDQAKVEGEHDAQDDAAEIDQDPEEEERQRRAAIAARMARLGGARVGMGVPVFGGKPAPKKPETPPPQPKQEQDAIVSELPPDVTSPPIEALSPPTSVKEEARADSEYFPTRKDSDSSLLSFADSASGTAPSRSPSSMPVPAGPRRAAPPRKKAYKSPSASQLSEVPAPAAVPEATEEVEEAAHTAEPAAELTPDAAPESVTPPSLTKVTSHETVESPEQVLVRSSEQMAVTGDAQREIGEVGESAEFDAAEAGPVEEREEEERYDDTDESQPEPKPKQEDQEEEEEDEEERRKRVAAKLSQMGAVNPLAGLPSVPRRESIPSPTARQNSVSAHVPTQEPLDVEDEVNVDLEEVGESVPPPPPAHSLAQAHNEEPEEAREAREADEFASRAAESYDEAQPDSGTTRRVLYYDEEEPYEDDGDQHAHVLSELEGELGSPSASEAPTFDVAITAPPPPPRPIPQEDEDYLIQSGASAQAPSTDAVDSALSDNAREDLAQNPNQDQDDDEMAPARITRPIPPPPVNLSSKPSISLPSPPPPPRTPLYALQTDEDRPESPAPRPVPPPVKSVKAAEEVPPAPPARVARRTSASAKSVDMEAPPTPPPVPITPRPPARRPTSPPIITALPLIVPAPATEEDAEREFVDSETPSQPQQYQEPSEEDEEAVRRRTIAERMARLGGIRFGAPPVLTPLTRSTFPRAPPPTSIPPDEPEVDTNELAQEQTETEEDEVARKQRISAKLAGMGGMRFGMLPLGAGVAPATTRRLASRQEDSENEDAALPVPAPAPPPRRPPPPVEVDSEQEQSQGTSDDGVRVELEESEIEEVCYSDVEMRPSFEEEAPPPPPPRRSLSVKVRSADVLPTPPPRMTSRSPPPLGRPPVPSIPASLLNRRPSVAAGSTPSSRKSSVDYSVFSETNAQKQRAHQALESVLSDSVVEPQSEYVMVEPESATEEERSPVPPRRRSFRAPPRSAPPPPPPPPPSAIDPPEEMVGSIQWELPSIPQAASEFGDEGEGELNLSGFSDDSTFRGSRSPSTRESQSRRTSGQTAHPADQQLSADELMAIWGKVGVQMVESATMLFDKSKRSLVGDGSYAGFVRAVIGQVPNAQRPSLDGEDWGYMIYAQTASSVQRRVAEIMPGDVIAFWDAKLKGHKGLQTYSQNVGAGENGPLLGVVSEVEGKKSKVRVWQANQHVGQQVSSLRRWRRKTNGALTQKATQTVENVSYRLEDLKSGNVKVFRIMEA
ncbi:hypothetical protein AZE42_06829 [Rhizopogon vesiculosus]|uniref:BBC1/AIM3 cysteine proteinase-fold domain-containing protein n=1 Tax=Rhizopogon vesiculosus TaxID=180088 RepID=A0A1J8QB96_9AGAM|nr:hypothetical protein AZE42_06829 [Rhizopogon vesiculosus]